ncbi:CFAP57 [Acrasis kona]|uniref:CFAP57 n=1 Tax=Acrasis kona TaxID=1008807 RepID=A0AAW2ZJD3_9EUKA
MRILIITVAFLLLVTLSCAQDMSTDAQEYDSHDCWPCPSGNTHWYDIGLKSPPDGDRCQCIPNEDLPATTASPPTTTSPPPELKAQVALATSPSHKNMPSVFAVGIALFITLLW